MEKPVDSNQEKLANYDKLLQANTPDEIRMVFGEIYGDNPTDPDDELLRMKDEMLNNMKMDLVKAGLME